MCRSMTVFRSAQANKIVARFRPNFRRVTSLLAVVGVMGISSAIAKDPVGSETRSNKASSVHGQADSESITVPECLEKLKLSAKQQDQVKQIIAEYHDSIGMVWKQYSDRYMQTITMETAMLAAIEDNLTEPQRQQVRDQRHKTAQHEKVNAATGEKPNRAATKPDAAVEEDIASEGITLTAQQEAAADKVHSQYRSQLRSMHRDIQGLHTRLISLEADKLVAIEKVLTKDQLTQLRLSRQSAPGTAKTEVSTTEPTKTE